MAAVCWGWVGVTISHVQLQKVRQTWQEDFEANLPELQHWYDPDSDATIALCGKDISNEHWCPDDYSCGCIICPACEAMDVLDS